MSIVFSSLSMKKGWYVFHTMGYVGDIFRKAPTVRHPHNLRTCLNSHITVLSCPCICPSIWICICTCICPCICTPCICRLAAVNISNVQQSSLAPTPAFWPKYEKKSLSCFLLLTLCSLLYSLYLICYTLYFLHRILYIILYNCNNSCILTKVK